MPPRVGPRSPGASMWKRFLLYVPYVVDAPDIVNAAFRELYPHGLPPATPLALVRRGVACT